MKCEKCGKNEAIAHYQLQQGATSRLLHLCHDCAAQLGLDETPWHTAAYGLPGLFSLRSTPTAERICPNCGLRESALRRTARVGCAECYTSFSDVLLPYLQKIHGATTHIGGTPQADPPQDATEALRTRLQAAITAEDYEQAARLRDEIHRLEAQSS